MSEKSKIIPSYENKNNSNIKQKKLNATKSRKSKITIILLVLITIIIFGIVFGIFTFVNNKKYKPYRPYEEKVKIYGFDKVYNNGYANTGESITKSEAIKMVIAITLNMSDISGISKAPEGDNDYDNAIWVDYAKYRGIITDTDVNKDNYKDKASYIEVIRYLATAKTKILEKELDSAVQLKVKDIEKYKTDEQVAIEDMVQNEIIKINTRKINGNKHIFKGQMNELIANFVEKYNTITVNGEKLNINEEKMPSNKEVYPYTVTSVDKSIYEKEFNVDDENNFINPKDLYTVKKEHYQQIQEIAEGYYDLILNVDYNNIDYEKLKNKISKYVLYGTSGLKEYVDYVKEHKIQIEGKSSVMFPVIYYNGIEYVVRMKLEFEIKNTDTRNNLLYMDPINRTNKNIKYENDKYVIYIDAKMGNSISGSNALYNNNSMIYDLLLKDQKDIMVRE